MGIQGAFRALADPTRREILQQLSHHPQTIAEIASRFDVTRGAIRKHLTVLEEGGLIAVEKSGRERINHLRPEALKPAFDWLGYFDRFWDDHLTRLQTALADEDRHGKATKRTGEHD